jgi:multiple sugar transport system permease protein
VATRCGPRCLSTSNVASPRGQGVGLSTRSVLLYVYDQGFSGYRLGYASAIANIFFLIVVQSIAQLRLFNRREA